MARLLLIISLLLIFISCRGQEQPRSIYDKEEPMVQTVISKVDSFYVLNKGNELISESKGTVSNGELINGKLVPFSGNNFNYFDTSSYLGERAFLNDKVLATVIETYDSLAARHPDRMFTIMECSNKHGGKITPHRTHQNGLSIDFMVPIKKNGAACYELDQKGASHYLLSFDDEGRYVDDPELQIDFDLTGEHIVLLQTIAEKNGLQIEKVILKMELKDELYESEYGDEIQKKGIYVTRNLSPLINSLHDDHYHIDFKFR